MGEKRGYQANGPYKDYLAELEFVICEKDISDQCIEVVKRIKNEYLHGVAYHEMAILCGNKYQISDVCECLHDNAIDFYVSKHPFEISDILKWLQKCAGWVTNNDILFNEVYIFWEELNRHIDLIIDEKKIKLKRELYNILEDSNKYRENFKEWINYIIFELKLYDLLRKIDLYPDENDNLNVFIESLEKLPYKNYNLIDFYNMTTPDNQVIVSTRHGSKGLEFDVIFMIGMEEGSFPYFRCTKEEEKESYRICFVCVSRARKKCVLLYSKIITITPRNNPSFNKRCVPNRFWKMLYNKV